MTATGFPAPFTSASRSAGAPVVGEPMDGLYGLKVREITRAAFRQPPSFWLVCLYLFFEYVRPQAIYPWINILPWAQIVLIAAPIAILLEGKSLIPRSPLTWAMGLFSVAVVVSILGAQDPSLGWDKFSVYINWVVAFVLIASAATSQVRFFLFLLLFLLVSFKMGQHGVRSFVAGGFGFSAWGATGGPGWFHNSGEFGIQMCIFFPMSLYFIAALRERWGKGKLLLLASFPASAVISIVASSSRGALVGLAAVGLWMLVRSRYRIRGLVGLALLAGSVWLVLPAEQKERLSVMGDDGTSQNRLTYWAEGIKTIRQYPISGVGYENWQPYSRRTGGGGGLLHNIFLQAGAELGLFGLGSLLLLVGTSFVVTARIRKRARVVGGPSGRFADLTARGLDGAMIGFLVSGSFVTVLFYPYLWFAVGMTAALQEMVGRIEPAGLRAAGGAPATSVPKSRWRPGVLRGMVVAPDAGSQPVPSRAARRGGVVGATH